MKVSNPPGVRCPPSKSLLRVVYFLSVVSTKFYCFTQNLQTALSARERLRACSFEANICIFSMDKAFKAKADMEEHVTKMMGDLKELEGVEARLE